MVTKRTQGRDLRIVVIDGIDYEITAEELQDRIRSVLTPLEREPNKREMKGTAQKAAAQLKYRDIVLDYDTRTAFRSSRDLKLTRLEFDLLEYLIHNRGRYVSIEDLSDNVWDVRFKVRNNLVENKIHFLRRKLTKAGEADIVENKRNLGYRIR